MAARLFLVLLEGVSGSTYFIDGTWMPVRILTVRG